MDYLRVFEYFLYEEQKKNNRKHICRAEERREKSDYAIKQKNFAVINLT